MEMAAMSAMSALVFCLVQVVITGSNLLLMRRLRASELETDQPYVSILVPARNEEDNIFACVDSLCRQNYQGCEVIVLNDQSEDGTALILQELCETYAHLHVIQGKGLPAGWYGKHWACWQLVQRAKGSFVLFTDADTQHHPDTLRASVAKAQAENLDLLTAVVHQKMETWGERLTVSFPVWAIATLYPLVLGRAFGWAGFSAVNGQFMLFRRERYVALGGHKAVRSHAADDMALGRLAIRAGYRWAVHDATALVSCRMYRSFGQAVEGFTKNYFALFDYRVALAAFVWLWMVFITWVPLVMLLGHFGGLAVPGFAAAVSGVVLLVQALLWWLPVVRYRMHPVLVLLFPFVVTLASLIGFRSMIRSITGLTAWKGRTLGRSSVRWF